MKKNAHEEMREKMSKLDLLALFITNKVGTMGFFFVILIWTAVWLSWNLFAPDALRFDPLPACVLLLLISNFIQLFLMPLIMVGQNLQSRHAEARAEFDLQVNIKAEKEIETILLHLRRQNCAILKMEESMLENLHRGKK